MILKPRYVARFREVVAVLIRHGFADVLVELDLQRFLPGREHKRATPEAREQHRARSLRLALEELGTTYVKLGQLLSTRPDLLPPAFIEELEHLQNRVQPFPAEQARAAIAEELGQPVEELFDGFDPAPIASASLAQVHRARLRAAQGPHPAGLPVAVKVLRPAVEREVELDLEILSEVARMVARAALGRKVDAIGLVGQLQQTLTEELDLGREARNQEHFRGSLARYRRLRIPEVVDPLTTRRVFVSEYVEGRPLAELEPGAAPAGLADELWRGYLKEILVDGIFQCDPHPGNFLLDGEGRIVLLDHGMVAHVGREAQLQLLSLLLALADHDGERVAEACIEIGLPGSEFEERRFRAEVGQMVARLASLPVGRLDLGQVFVDIVRTAFHHDIQIPSTLLLLGKTLLNLEGVCRRLDPALVPVETMREMSSELLSHQLEREVSRQRALGVALEARALAVEVPASLRRILRRAASNDFRVGLRLEGAEELQGAIQKVAGRITLGLITAALIIGSAMLLNVPARWMIAGYPVFALAGFLLAAGLGIYLVVKIIVLDRY